jgi:hypothetical protein
LHAASLAADVYRFTSIGSGNRDRFRSRCA